MANEFREIKEQQQIIIEQMRIGDIILQKKLQNYTNKNCNDYFKDEIEPHIKFNAELIEKIKNLYIKKEGIKIEELQEELKEINELKEELQNLINKIKNKNK